MAIYWYPLCHVISGVKMIICRFGPLTLKLDKKVLASELDLSLNLEWPS